MPKTARFSIIYCDGKPKTMFFSAVKAERALKRYKNKGRSCKIRSHRPSVARFIMLKHGG